MELSLLLVDPLPARGAWIETVELEVSVLIRTFLDRALVAVSDTSEIDNLLFTNGLDFKFDDLIDACALLSPISDAAAPQVHAVELKVVLVCVFELFNCRRKLVLEFEQNVLPEPFA